MISIIIDKITRQYGRRVGTMAWTASAWGGSGRAGLCPLPLLPNMRLQQNVWSNLKYNVWETYWTVACIYSH